MTTSSTQTLTADEIKRTVHALIPDRFANVEEVADEIGVARSGLYRYMTTGQPSRMNRSVRRRLLELAAETALRYSK